MNAKGIALISSNIKNKDRVYLPDISQFEGQVVIVMDRNNEGDCLCLSKEGSGLGDVLSEDVIQFLPVIKKNGVIMPTNLSFIEQSMWYGRAMEMGVEKFNLHYVMKCVEANEILYNF